MKFYELLVPPVPSTHHSHHPSHVDRYQTPPAPVLPLVGQFEYTLWRHILLRLLLLFSNFEYTPFALRIYAVYV